MGFTKEHLEYFAGIPTPPHTTIYHEGRQEELYDYCCLRNSAKDLLEDSENEEAKENLFSLIQKLGIEL